MDPIDWLNSKPDRNCCKDDGQATRWWVYWNGSRSRVVAGKTTTKRRQVGGWNRNQTGAPKLDVGTRCRRLIAWSRGQTWAQLVDVAMTPRQWVGRNLSQKKVAAGMAATKCQQLIDWKKYPKLSFWSDDARAVPSITWLNLELKANFLMDEGHVKCSADESNFQPNWTTSTSPQVCCKPANSARETGK